MKTPMLRVAELLQLVRSAGVRPAELLCDRHPEEAVAFTIIEGDALTARDLTYGELRLRSEQVAAALAGLGVGPGERVASLMSKSEDLVSVMLGIWRVGAVYLPLFTAFAPAAIAHRLLAGGAKVVVSDASQLHKLTPSDDFPAEVPWVTIVAGKTPSTPPADPLNSTGYAELRDLIAAENPGYPAARRNADDELVRLFTSGTTGRPKAVPVPVSALATFATYFEYGLDVQESDVFWNVADPGWAYGLYFGILAPLFAGQRNLLLQNAFNAQQSWQVLERFEVTNLAAAPTFYRALRAADGNHGAMLVLRACSSAGEPLNPEVSEWAQQHLGTAIRDHYGQTELGMAIIDGWHTDIRRNVPAGSMGYQMPGYAAEVLERNNEYVAAVGVDGRIAIDVRKSPLMWFEGYSDDTERSAERFSADRRWYFTGDVASKDISGTFHFSAREDDVILTAGYRIGPFEIESALLSHPAVLEAAVVGVPDELRGEIVEAYVVVRHGLVPGIRLAEELGQHVKQHYAAHAFPRKIHFLDELPKTPSGKIQRFQLRERRLGGGQIGRRAED